MNPKIEKETTEQHGSESRTWKEWASEVVHNPYADVAMAAGALALVVATKGKLGGMIEDFFPKADEIISSANAEYKSVVKVESQLMEARPIEAAGLLPNVRNAERYEDYLSGTGVNPLIAAAENSTMRPALFESFGGLDKHYAQRIAKYGSKLSPGKKLRMQLDFESFRKSGSEMKPLSNRELAEMQKTFEEMRKLSTD